MVLLEFMYDQEGEIMLLRILNRHHAVLIITVADLKGE